MHWNAKSMDCYKYLFACLFTGMDHQELMNQLPGSITRLPHHGKPNQSSS
jgi:hypothetical protein